MVNILLSSVGRRVELIEAFRQAYRELGISGNIVGTDINPIAPGLHSVDCPYIVPPIASEKYIETLVKICEREKIGLVFPLVDPDIPKLSRARAAFESVGTKLAVIAPEAAEIANDKWLTSQFFDRLGIPSPRSWLPQEVPRDEAFPLFLKPRFGSASQGTFKLKNRHELAFFSDYVSMPIVQEYLPGAEITSDVVCDMNGNVIAVTSRKRLEVRGGEVVKGVTIYDPVITKTCVRIAEALPTIGPITIQCIEKNGKLYFTEINARFGGGLPLAIAAGVNSPKILLALEANVPITIPPLGAYKTGLYVSRFDNGYYIDEQGRDEMAKRSI